MDHALLAKLCWTPLIRRTERDHAGNQIAEKQPCCRARSLRRQVACYINRRAKHRWATISKEHAASLRNLAGMPRPQFADHMASRLDRPRTGGNPLYNYVNQEMAKLRARGFAGRNDLHRKWFAAKYRRLGFCRAATVSIGLQRKTASCASTASRGRRGAGR